MAANLPLSVELFRLVAEEMLGKVAVDETFKPIVDLPVSCKALETAPDEQIPDAILPLIAEFFTEVCFCSAVVFTGGRMSVLEEAVILTEGMEGSDSASDSLSEIPWKGLLLAAEDL